MLDVAFGVGFVAARHLTSMLSVVAVFGSIVLAGAWVIDRFSLHGLFGETW